MEEKAKKIWETLRDIPVNDDGCIEQPFEHFEVGADINDIYSWIEETFGVSIVELMGLIKEKKGDK